MDRFRSLVAGPAALAFLLFCVALFAACGDDKDQQAAVDGSAVADGGSPPDALMSQRDGAISPDTEPTVKTIPTPTKGDIDTHSACAAVCQSKGATCSTTCDKIGAGQAKYGYVNKYGWYTIVKTVDLADCQHAPAKSETHDSKSHDLATWYCCCDLPEPHKITKASGDMNNIQSCDGVCNGVGKACDSKHNWGSAIPGQPNIGGIKAWYHRTETGGSSYVYTSCGFVPPLQKKVAGFMRTLMGYTCACY
jgi:hypothetical protein